MAVARASDAGSGAGVTALADWYLRHGRHDLPWRRTRDRWHVLVSEVMLQQTQVARVAAVWDAFIRRFPTPEAMARAGAGEVIRAWDRLGYPRRARRLWEAATVVAAHGWPDDLTRLPGVGPYTAGAVAAETDNADVPAVDANIRRVVERHGGGRLGDRAAEQASVRIAAPLVGRDRLLSLMDLGALVCRPRAPRCDECPLGESCATRGVLPDTAPRRQPGYEGSFRQRRGLVLAAIRDGERPVAGLDPEALASLAADGLAVVAGDSARLP